MTSFLRALFSKWKNAPRERKLAIVVALSAAILGAYIATPLSWYTFYIRTRPPVYSDLVKYGDEAFTDYRYDEALTFYKRAEARLDAVIKFENESPSQNVNVLQRYDNSKVFITARIELVSIAKNISRTKTRNIR